MINRTGISENERTPMRLVIIVVLLAVVRADAPVAYPEGYRKWTHVKSGAIGPASSQYSSIGGFQHIYANAQAMAGYRTRVFPEGSVVVFDWLEMRDKAGAFEE